MTVGYQAVQSIHAMREFIACYPELDLEWYNNSNYIALLVVENENELIKLLSKADKKCIKSAFFQEPDINNQITAIVLEPSLDSRRLCANLRLMGS